MFHTEGFLSRTKMANASGWHSLLSVYDTYTYEIMTSISVIEYMVYTGCVRYMFYDLNVL